jgi:beta-phosphoglucomutase
LRGVIFDMDGVLCDSEAFMSEAACRMFIESHGVRACHEDFLPFLGRGENRYLGGVAAKHGVTLEMPRDKDRAYAIYLEIIRGRLRPLPGVMAFIERCQALGLRMSVATGADRIKLDGNLREMGIAPETFTVCVTGGDIVMPKPDPEIFLRAAKGMGLAPEQCLVAEDATSGVRAARAAGCLCLGITSTFTDEVLLEAGATWTIPNLESALARFEEIVSGRKSDA